MGTPKLRISYTICHAENGREVAGARLDLNSGGEFALTEVNKPTSA
jgi:hypothetical protein